METNDNDEGSALEILSAIKHFWVRGKLSEERLNKATENILQAPDLVLGTSFQEIGL